MKLATARGPYYEAWSGTDKMDRARSRRIAIGRVVGAHFLTECTKGGIVAGVDVPDLLLIGRGLLFVRFTFLF